MREFCCAIAFLASGESFSHSNSGIDVIDDLFADLASEFDLLERLRLPLEDLCDFDCFLDLSTRFFCSGESLFHSSSEMNCLPTFSTTLS
jgi:hypothetical protein